MTDDWSVLKSNFKFIPDGEEESTKPEDWGKRAAKRYISKLYKEYAIADLSGGRLGLRWRTEAEVISGKGQFVCGMRNCQATEDLASYELNFRYREDGQVKQELVKVRVCPSCKSKLQGHAGSKKAHQHHASKKPSAATVSKPEQTRMEQKNQQHDGPDPTMAAASGGPMPAEDEQRRAPTSDREVDQMVADILR